MEPVFVGVQGSYQHVEMALYRGGTLLGKTDESGTRASSYFIPLLHELLNTHDVALSDLSFMAIDQGPGAFTSLRVTIITANALGFSLQLPLIGVDGLDALANQALAAASDHENRPQVIVPLLNAYNHDVYTGLYHVKKTNNGFSLQAAFKGCRKAEDFLGECAEKELSDMPPSSILFVGNALPLHQEFITEKYGQRVMIDAPIIQVCSAEQVARSALKAWHTGEKKVYKLQPQYLKSQLFAVRKKL